MRSGVGYSRGLRALLAVGVSLAALTVGFASLGETSEMASYKAAIKSQSEADALQFIRDYGSGHMVDDLIRSLKSDVALQGCTALQGGTPAEVRDAYGAFPTTVTSSQIDTAAPPPAQPQGDGTSGNTATVEPDLFATVPDLVTGEGDLFATTPAAAPAAAPAASPAAAPSGPPINGFQGGHDNGGRIFLRPTLTTTTTTTTTATPAAPMSAPAPTQVTGP